MDLFDDHQPPEVDIPWTLNRAITVFLNHWSWRGERAVIEQELRQLIADAKEHGE